jgi:hypothetical protein
MDPNNYNLKGRDFNIRHIYDDYNEKNRINIDNKSKNPMSYYFPEGKRDQMENHFPQMDKFNMFNQESYFQDHYVYYIKLAKGSTKFLPKSTY